MSVARAAWLLLGVVPLFAVEDPRAIMKRALDADRRNQEITRNYTFIQRSLTERLNGDGSLKRRELRTYDFTMSEGTPYRRLIAIDDKPLEPAMERREQEKLQADIELRRKETPEQRAKRLADWEKRRNRERAVLVEALDAMDFHILGEEMIRGRKAWVIEATPHPGYRPRSNEARILPKAKGKFWIDQQDYLAARVEAELIDDVTWALFVVKLHKGTRFELDQVRVNDEVWLPSHMKGRFSLRVAVSYIRENFEASFRNFRKFQVDSRVISSEPGK
ncbi:MAG TPA: hypothetical protein VHA11_11595 [Bryobacteraceae bacterium]|nr:hypothetical protein [Bryobacteraceae bacterium]